MSTSPSVKLNGQPFAVSMAQIAGIERKCKPIYDTITALDGTSVLSTLMKAEEVPETAKASSQGVNLGRKQHPFNMRQLALFQTSNEHHSTCIQTKAGATVGLGFEAEGEAAARKPDPMTGEMPEPPDTAARSVVDEVLDPLCEHSFQDVLNDVAEDYHQCGNGYMEIVRKGKGDEITGIHHLPAAEVYVYLEDRSYRRHYEIVSCEDMAFSRHFARFGDSDDFMLRSRSGNRPINWEIPDPSVNGKPSEVIHFRRPTSLSRWYGYPNWLACVAAIELMQMLRQYHYDFFLNRGVPEHILLFCGIKFEQKDWDKLETQMKKTAGLGNSHKSLMANIHHGWNENSEIVFHKMAAELREAGEFSDMSDSLALSIVTAHRVPPLLAGIQIPGKLGATNELPNALQAFQALVIAQDQKNFHSTLSATLANPKKNGGLGLRPEDFRFRKITNIVDVGTMDTVARMRQTVPEARSQGRDIKAGLKD